MKIFFLLMTLLFISSGLLASDNNISQFDTSSGNYTLQRIQMVRQGKILTNEYHLVEKKLQSWQQHKQKLIRDFERKSGGTENLILGSDNNYAYIRAQKRKKEFYQSLEKKEREIKKRLLNIAKKLSDLKNKFLFQFTVPLTENEMFHGRKPIIIDIKKKLKMLGTYIDYRHSYEAFRKRNQKFDDVKSLMVGMDKMNQKEKIFDQNMTARADANQTKMDEYKVMADKLAEEFYNKYGIYIDNENKAIKLMHNIKISAKNK